MVTASSYAGTSNLFAAYLAGVVVTWSDGLGNEYNPDFNSITSGENHLQQERPSQQSSIVSQQDDGAAANEADETTVATAERIVQPDRNPMSLASSMQTTQDTSNSPASVPVETSSTGLSIYNRYYHPITSTILKPLFFASIGFSIPISQMFIGRIIWRGFVYATLMAIGKLLCGIFLIRFSVPSFRVPLPRPKIASIKGTWREALQTCLSSRSRNKDHTASSTTTTGGPSSSEIPNNPTADEPSSSPPLAKKKASQNPKPPRSLYPAATLGTAMVARGEIGFLVSSIAQSNGIFSQASEGGEVEYSDLFLVVTWAILICTVIGPVAVGLMVKRVRRLQQGERKGDRSGREDPLGVWGVVGGR
jgi:hypothetical protein